MELKHVGSIRLQLAMARELIYQLDGSQESGTLF
jgi:hypothetical protein